MDHLTPVNSNTPNIIPLRLFTQKIRKLIQIFDPLIKYRKTKHSKQTNATSSLKKKPHLLHLKNVDPARRSNTESHQVPRYVKKYSLVTAKDKSTLTSDLSKPKNETTTRPKLPDLRPKTLVKTVSIVTISNYEACHLVSF